MSHPTLPNISLPSLILAYTLCTLSSIRVSLPLYRPNASLDNNVLPRENLARIERDIQAGKGNMPVRVLNRFKRQHAAHLNNLENFPLFVGAILAINLRPSIVSTSEANRFSIAYLSVRLAYTFLYVYGDTYEVSLVRSLAWWTGSLSCFWQIAKVARRLSAQ